MSLPVEATIEYADDPEAIRYVLDHPRQIERDGWVLTGARMDDQLLDFIMTCDERYLIRVHGEPVAVFYMASGPGWVEYEITCTPVVERYPVAYTRCTRDFIRQSQRDYPASIRHFVRGIPNTTQHRWLKALGFVDTDTLIDHAGGQLRLMELPAA